MRPVTIEMAGFGAFREHTVIDLADAEFFALVGPTGSGKSTVIDAICFALYGAVPRYGDERLVTPVLSVGANEAKVRLTFDVSGVRHVATRVVRRVGGRAGPGQTASGERSERAPSAKATTKEARLERLLPDGTVEVLAGKEKELGAEVERLLGMPFAHFTRSVVLPQGEFARFLHDKPADRQQLLVRLLDYGVYEAVARTANQRATEREAELRFVDQRLTELAGADAAAEAAIAADLERARAAIAAIEELLPCIDAATEQAKAAEASAAAQRELLERLTAVAVPAAAHELGGLARDALDAQRVAEAEVLAAEQRLRVAEKVVAELPNRAGLLAAQQAHHELARTDEEHDRVRAEREALLAALPQLEHAVTAAIEAEQTARARLAEHQRAHAASHLADALQAGHPCPVCQQKVKQIPLRFDLGDLAELERAVTEASRAVTSADRASTKAQAACDASGARLAELARATEAAATIAAAYPDPAAIAASLGELDRADTTIAATRRELERARRQHDAASEAVAAASRRSEKAWRLFEAQRDGVAALRPPVPDRVDLVADWTQLATWAQHECTAVDAAVAAAVDAARSARVEADALTAKALTCGTTHLDRAATTPRQQRDALVRAEAAAAARLERVRQDRQEAVRLAERAAGARDEADVARRLAQLLSARNFERWLVTEALELLVEGAAAIMRRLSAGAYSLALEPSGEFAVIDHRNADERRSTRTLSGGETFQASLALALALADQLGGLAADQRGKLESIFLDEGFGTLDAETLDTVAGTIEALGGEGRMVGIVTHVRELAERVPLRYVVRKDLTGASVTKEWA